MSPSQIDITGLTHLYYAFAGFDPKTFKMVSPSSAEAPTYKAFTALKSAKLQTWIAVGGAAFNDPGPTQSAWYAAINTNLTKRC